MGCSEWGDARYTVIEPKSNNLVKRAEQKTKKLVFNRSQSSDKLFAKFQNFWKVQSGLVAQKKRVYYFGT